MAMSKGPICIEREASFPGTHQLLEETKSDMTLKQVINKKLVDN